MNDTVPFLDIAAAVAEQRPELDALWAKFLDSGMFIMGPELAAFETSFANFTGTAHAIGVGNGLDALAFALEAAGIGPGDEVIVPAHTFIATWQAVRMIGAVPVAAEPAPGQYNSGAPEFDAAITPRTRALVPVHLYGDPVAMEPVMALAAKHEIVVVEDAAQAHGARRNGQPMGSFGLAASFSFYPAKNLGALGDGGAVVTSDAGLAERVSLLRNYGSVRKYEHDAHGRNSRLDPLQAAVLSLRLTRLEAWNAARRAIAAQYFTELAGMNGLTLPPQDPANEPAWHLFVIRTAARDKLAAHLAEQGIGSLVHYPRPVYRFAPFASAAPASGSPADQLCTQILSLPIGPHQSAAQTSRVVAAIKSYFGQ
ncbi:MAG: DegT/DnrJ/EryC1/StrS family aminotransferase [Rhodobacteraceae bacterium]|nr:DegT/DnrJ/EryC1/StrS family aminotransferase [Paracoccaceae bacterium]